MAYVDGYLDPVTGDLPQVSRLTSGVELIEQRIRLRLQRGLDEWFLDPTAGLPLIAWREQKPPDLAQIVALTQREIRAVPGVTTTVDFVAVHDNATRAVTVTGTALYDTEGASTVLVVCPPPTERNTSPWTVHITSRRINGLTPQINAGRL